MCDRNAKELIKKLYHNRRRHRHRCAALVQFDAIEHKASIECGSNI